MAGASFRKCDFQVHSPRDPMWQGARPPGIDTAKHGNTNYQIEEVISARREWAARFIDVCVARGLQAVAITDHHDMVMVKYVQEGIEKRKEDEAVDLWLFPGMEVTCSEGIQCLLLFDADTNDKAWHSAMGRLGIDIGEVDELCSKGPSVQPLSLTYDMLKEEIEKLPGMQNNFIVLPNCSENGENTALRRKFNKRFSNMPYVGGYLDDCKTLDDLKPGTKQKLLGKDPSWGTKVVYPLSTSDSRSAGFEKLGENNAWIKLSEPTAEAIRQSFLAHESRIRTHPPHTPSIFVKSLRIQGTHPFSDTAIELNPEFNGFIGGRGTGKSTILEYLAFALGRSSYDIPRETYDGTERLVALVNDTLLQRGGEVVAEVVHDAAVFSITRGASNDYKPVVAFPDGNTQTLTASELRALLPSTVYSQGELAELGSNHQPTSRLSPLLTFIQSPFKAEVDEFRAKIEASQQVIREGFQKLVEFWRVTAERNRAETQSRALHSRILALQKSIPNLSQEDASVLIKFAEFSSANQHLKQAVEEVENFFSELNVLRHRHFSTLTMDIDDSPKELRDAIDCYNQFSAKVTTALTAVSDQLVRDAATISKRMKPWDAYLEKMGEKRIQAMQKVGAKEQVLDQIKRLQTQVNDEVKNLRRLEHKLSLLGEPEKTVWDARTNLTDCVKAWNSSLGAWCKEIEKLSGGLVKVSIDEYGDTKEIHRALTQLSSGTGSHESVRHREFDAKVSENGVDEILKLLIQEAILLLKWSTFSFDTKPQPEQDYPTLSHILGEADSIRSAVLDQITLEAVSSLLVATARPLIDFKYKSGTQTISFEKASEGQRAAVLLMMLLRQQGGPLIIDQPESDLDNNIIAEVANQLHSAKENRQIVVVTHNANLIVNGAAELVNLLETDPTGIRRVGKTGVIDSAEIKVVITNTMEGGEKAFKGRKAKYGF